MSKTDALVQLEKFNSVFTTMLSIAGTKVKTVKYCSGWHIVSQLWQSGNRGATDVDNDDFDNKFSLA
jgi:hypothetical protein